MAIEEQLQSQTDAEQGKYVYCIIKTDATRDFGQHPYSPRFYEPGLNGEWSCCCVPPICTSDPNVPPQVQRGARFVG